MARIIQGAGKLNTKMPASIPCVVKAFLPQLRRKAKDFTCFILLVYIDFIFIIFFFEAQSLLGSQQGPTGLEDLCEAAAIFPLHVLFCLFP